MTDEYFMRLAIEKAREGLQKGQTPFGACIVKNDEVVSCNHNTVWDTTDITAHAEVTAIRAACKNLNSIDLSGTVIYSTCEPCPMCFSAIHWAGIDKIVYGAVIADAGNAGFNELTLSNQKIKELTDSKIELEAGFLRTECQALFNEWLDRRDKKAY